MVGTIVCAHCNCMAGLGEPCSHIAALLYATEANTSLLKNTSCTSQPCSWLPASTQSVDYAPISDIDFATPAMKRLGLLQHTVKVVHHSFVQRIIELMASVKNRDRFIRLNTDFRSDVQGGATLWKGGMEWESYLPH